MKENVFLKIIPFIIIGALISCIGCSNNNNNNNDSNDIYGVWEIKATQSYEEDSNECSYSSMEELNQIGIRSYWDITEEDEIMVYSSTDYNSDDNFYLITCSEDNFTVIINDTVLIDSETSASINYTINNNVLTISSDEEHDCLNYIEFHRADYDNIADALIDPVEECQEE